MPFKRKLHIRCRFRGLKKVEMQFLLIVTALNLKKMVKMVEVIEIKSSFSRKFTDIIQNVKDIFKNFVKKLGIEMSWATSLQGFAPSLEFNRSILN